MSGIFNFLSSCTESKNIIININLKNLKVDIVSWQLILAGEQLIIKAVLEFPPKDCSKIRVNLEST